jgi:transcriptional regulator with XRE-family HTH domain
MPWLFDLKQPDLSTQLVPLSEWVALGSRRRMDSFSHNTNKMFRYLKVGSQDALAFPDLLPGSIVRVRDDFSILNRAPVGKTPGRTLFLVQHGRGTTCSRLFRPESDRIVLCSRQLPYAPIELRVGAEGVVVGAADIEIRPLGLLQKPVISANLERYRVPIPLARSSPKRSTGEFIQRARKACGFSFREASERTHTIARELGDRRYYCSPGTLSDYETRQSAPRHIQKLVSIAAVYFIGAADLFKACGAALDQAGAQAMPSEFLHSPEPTPVSASKPSQFLIEMERRFGPVPWFLRFTGPSLFGLRSVTPRDVFWVGDFHEPKYSCLAGIYFLVVDRRQKRPRVSLSAPIWAQPMYVLQKRGGTYLWGFCRQENDMLLLSHPAQRAKPVRLRNGVDAEVVGRVVGVIRTLI